MYIHVSFQVRMREDLLSLQSFGRESAAHEPRGPDQRAQADEERSGEAIRQEARGQGEERLEDAAHQAQAAQAAYLFISINR